MPLPGVSCFAHPCTNGGRLSTRHRGSIYRAEFSFGRKPVLVISWNAVNEGLRQPICALITTNVRDRSIPTYVEIDPSESGIPEPSFVLCHAIFVKDEREMDAHAIGELSYPKMLEVERAIARALDFIGASDPSISN